jgi:hypothetical protein
MLIVLSLFILIGIIFYQDILVFLSTQLTSIDKQIIIKKSDLKNLVIRINIEKLGPHPNNPRYFFILNKEIKTYEFADEPTIEKIYFQNNSPDKFPFATSDYYKFPGDNKILAVHYALTWCEAAKIIFSVWEENGDKIKFISLLDTGIRALYGVDRMETIKISDNEYIFIGKTTEGEGGQSSAKLYIASLTIPNTLKILYNKSHRFDMCEKVDIEYFVKNNLIIDIVTKKKFCIDIYKDITSDWVVIEKERFNFETLATTKIEIHPSEAENNFDFLNATYELYEEQYLNEDNHQFKFEDGKWRGPVQSDQIVNIKFVKKTNYTGYPNEYSIYMFGAWGGGNTETGKLLIGLISDNRFICLDNISHLHDPTIPVFEKSFITIFNYEWEASDANCCPTWKTISKYRLEDNKFIEVSYQKVLR